MSQAQHDDEILVLSPGDPSRESAHGVIAGTLAVVAIFDGLVLRTLWHPLHRLDSPRQICAMMSKGVHVNGCQIRIAIPPGHPEAIDWTVGSDPCWSDALETMLKTLRAGIASCPVASHLRMDLLARAEPFEAFARELVVSERL